MELGKVSETNHETSCGTSIQLNTFKRSTSLPKQSRELPQKNHKKSGIVHTVNGILKGGVPVKKKESNKHSIKEVSLKKNGQTTDPKEQPNKKNLKRKNTENLKSNKKPCISHGVGTKNFVSSLFSKNPSIPNIKSECVGRLHEEVFTKRKFSDLSLHPHLSSRLEIGLGLTKMTRIQQVAIPQILQGNDCVIKSQTGSGKTLAYAVPLIENLQSLVPRVSRSDGVYVVIIVPTRELALQTYEAIRSLTQSFFWIVAGVVMGGECKKAEKARIRKGINILIATPGRMLDHINSTSCLNFQKLRYLVIDETDRLLDLGFEKDVAEIIKTLKSVKTEHPKRQTVLLSATLTSGVENLAGMALKDPVFLDVSDSGVSMKTSGDPDDHATADGLHEFTLPSTLQQQFVIVPSKLRLVTLTSHILWRVGQSGGKMIVFLSTQQSVSFHFRLLNGLYNKRSVVSILDEPSSNDEELGASVLPLFMLHGNLEQQERTRIYKEFNDADTGVLFCTDVAARGLDLHGVTDVVQYTPPASPREYVHRAGRTARIGVRGQSILFLSPSESHYLQKLNQHNIEVSEVKMETVLSHLLIRCRTDDLIRMQNGRVPCTAQECAIALQTRFEEHLQANKNLKSLARKAYQSYVRSYATYPAAMKSIFHVRSLHLGHLAKSFALHDNPKNIGSLIHKHALLHKKDIKQQQKKHEKTSVNRQGKSNSTKLSVTKCEFSSGFEGIQTGKMFKPKKVKPKKKNFLKKKKPKKK